MKKIVAFAGSNSSTSINYKLVRHVASLIEGHRVEVIKLTDYPLPLYSIDNENNEGFSAELNQLLDKLKDADGLMISVNEHNGTVSAFFKNTLDWLSRIDCNFLEGKKVVLMSTSPGKRGGLSALEYISGFLPRIKADVVASFTFPSFSENFSEEENRILNEDLATTVAKALDALVSE